MTTQHTTPATGTSLGHPAEGANIGKLLPIQDRAIGAGAIQSINARDLHAFLEVGKDFSTWIKDRVAQFGFVEGADFVQIVDLIDPQNGGTMKTVTYKGAKTAKEYALSLDMAKELSMVERNEKGKQARLYFIECERRAKAAPQINYLDPANILGFVQALQGEVAKKDEIIAVQGQRLKKLDVIEGADGSMCISTAAKTLGVDPIKNLFALLSAHRWIFKRPNTSDWLAYQDKIQAGYLEHADHLYKDSQGQERVRSRVLVTAKGLVKIAELLTAPKH
jgi:phage anti-repressor protein/phage antirepressor YoqD-like protein